MTAATTGVSRRHAAAHAAVVVAAVLFGATFVVVKDAVEAVDPYAFLAVRFAAGAAVLLPLAAVRARRSPARRPKGRALAGDGAVCGAVLAAGYALQTVGLQHTTGSVSAFVTYLLVVFVPLFAWAMSGRPPSARSVTAIGICTAGLVLLTGGPGGVGLGEALTLGCAVAFAGHVVLLARYAPRHDALWLNAVQLSVVAALCVVPGAVVGSYRFPPRAFAAAVFTGVAASAVALGLQVWAQARLPPVRVSILLLIEPVAAAVLGAVAGDRLGLVGAVGCLVILAGIVLGETGSRSE